MAQFLRPASDITVPASWNGSYLDINEVTADDTDYGWSDDATTDTYETAFPTSGIVDPLSNINHIVRFRIHNTNGGVLDDTAFYSSLAIYLYQGATLIATVRANGPVASAWTDVVYTLTSTEANNITNYNDLRLRFDYTGWNQGGTSKDRGVAVSWVEMEIPELVAENGYIKVWSGSAWEIKPLKFWDGSIFKTT